jgi:hypothetical protein
METFELKFSLPLNEMKSYRATIRVNMELQSNVSKAFSASIIRE